MGLKKGMTNNPEGRPIGAKNKVSYDIRGKIADFLEDNFDQIRQDIAGLEPRLRVKYYLDLLQYCLPRLQAVTTDSIFENLSDDELNYIVNELEKRANQGEQN